MIVMTGASSFTGCHIARGWIDQGLEVTGILTRPLTAYTDPLVLQRLQYSKIARWIENAPIGSPHLPQILQQHNFQSFVHHGWDTTSYHRQTDGKQELNQLTKAWQELLPLFVAKNIALVHTGTVYERHEGGHRDNIFLTQYGELKSLFWNFLQEEASTRNLKLSKVVLPNPFGPLENANKLLTSFWLEWQQGSTPILRTPHWIRDNISVQTLIDSYSKVIRNSGQNLVLRPTEFVLSNRELIQTLQKIARKAGLPNCDFSESANQDLDKAWIRRTNGSNRANLETLENYLSNWFTSAAGR